MAAGRGGQQQGGDNSLAPLWILIALGIGVGLVWYFFRSYIVAIFFKIKLWEIALLSFFTNNLESVKETIHILPPDGVTLDQLHLIAQQVGVYIRIPFVIAILALAFWVYRSGSAGAYRQTYNMETLAQLEKENWPQITPAVGLNLVETPITQMPWAMSLTPMEFAKKNKLIIEEEQQQKEGELRRRTVLARIDRGKANAMFTMQLGDLWQGVEALPDYARAIVAIFVARACRDTKAAYALIDQMARNFDNKKNTTDFSGADQLWKKHINAKPVQVALNGHAYNLTVMASLLKLARYDGVVATADFLWLKVYDRRLWYMLNTVGRQTPFVEVAGPYAHWLVECELQRKVIVPMVEEATNALELAIAELIYRPEEE
ncbi:MAG: type IVB secretion system coupling complex protein DotM/IcmP [Gammaproteobacteria bacterium]